MIMPAIITLAIPTPKAMATTRPEVERVSSFTMQASPPGATVAKQSMPGAQVAVVVVVVWQVLVPEVVEHQDVGIVEVSEQVKLPVVVGDVVFSVVESESVESSLFLKSSRSSSDTSSRHFSANHVAPTLASAFAHPAET